MLLGTVANSLEFRKDGPRLHSLGSPSGSPSGSHAAAEGSWGVCCAVAAPQSSVQCWKSCGSSSDMWATGLLWLHSLISLPLADFIPVINSQSRWTPQLNSCWLDRNSSFTEVEMEMGHFRKDMLLESCSCLRKTRDTIWLFRLLSILQPALLFFCKSLTYTHIGQIHFPLLRV